MLNHFDMIGIVLIMTWIIGFMLLGVGGAIHVLPVLSLLFLSAGHSVKHQRSQERV